MSSQSKPIFKSSKKAEFDTTLSAKLQSRATYLQELKTKVSPFQVQDPNQNSIIPALDSKQLKAIKDINYQYIQLYENLFKENKQLIELYQFDIINRNDSRVALTKEQRYQLECMKLLKKASENIEKLEQMRQVGEDWRKIVEYIRENKGLRKEQKMDKKQFAKQAKKLTQKYQEISNELQQAEKQYKSIRETDIELKQQTRLTSIQKQFKKNQRKLNKILNEEVYYEQKCSYCHNLLEQLQQKVKKIQQDKTNIKMKIIGQQGIRDKMLRKLKREKDKSISNAPQKESQQKVIRSKSVIKYNRLRSDL